MKITILGTAAAACIPLPFCDCPTCVHALQHGGRNIRRRCSYIINDDLMVDLGPDLYGACAAFGISLQNIKYAVVTHAHADHFYQHNLNYRRGLKSPNITVAANETTWVKFPVLEDARIDRMTIKPYERFSLSPYEISTVKATHMSAQGDAMNFVIEDGGRKVLIASDTGMYEDAVWEHLQDRRVDLVIIECTKAFTNKTPEHLNVGDMLLMLGKMKEIGTLHDGTRIVATHFGHKNVPPHDELDGKLREIGIECAYDGMVIEL